MWCADRFRDRSCRANGQRGLADALPDADDALRNSAPWDELRGSKVPACGDRYRSATTSISTSAASFGLDVALDHLFVAGSRAICPAAKTNPPALMACE